MEKRKCISDLITDLRFCRRGRECKLIALETRGVRAHITELICSVLNFDRVSF
jgi:hypothetical protein